MAVFRIRATTLCVSCLDPSSDSDGISNHQARGDLELLMNYALLGSRHFQKKARTQYIMTVSNTVDNHHKQSTQVHRSAFWFVNWIRVAILMEIRHLQARGDLELQMNYALLNSRHIQNHYRT